MLSKAEHAGLLDVCLVHGRSWLSVQSKFSGFAS